MQRHRRRHGPTAHHSRLHLHPGVPALGGGRKQLQACPLGLPLTTLLGSPQQQRAQPEGWAWAVQRNRRTAALSATQASACWRFGRPDLRQREVHAAPI